MTMICKFFVFLATHSQIFELCVDRSVGIFMGGILRISNFKIPSMQDIKTAQKIRGAEIIFFSHKKSKSQGKKDNFVDALPIF
jgi:hypothetical protein